MSPDQTKLEAETREEIDKKLISAGWVVRDKKRLNLHESLGVAVRDLTNLMNHVLRAVFFLSPCLYGTDLVRNLLESKLGGTAAQVGFYAYMLNPFAVLITGYRDAVFYGRFLPVELWLVLAVESGLLLVVGSLIYQRYDRRAIKYL